MRFKHYLNFLDLPNIGIIQIAETIGFDASSYKVKRDKKRFGRDIVIANEDTELIFTRSFFEELETSQILSNGEITNYASQGFDYLMDVFQNEGWESRIEYVLEKDGNTFVTGIFSYVTSVVEFDQIKVKIIQNTNRETIKRLEDTDIDVFSSVALDEREITPCTTTNILLKAKPIFQQSIWKSQENSVQAFATLNNFTSGKVLTSANNANITTKFEVKNTLSFLSTELNTNFAGELNTENFSYLYAQNLLTNVQIRITNIDASSSSQKVDVGGVITSASGYAKFVVRVGIDIDNIEDEYVLYSRTFTNTSSTVENLPTELSLVLPVIRVGYRLYIYAYCDADATFSSSPFINSYSTSLLINNLDIDITATSTAINTVVKGVRLIDLWKHNLKSIADVDLYAPDYDLGGEHYNNFAFNGLLLGQITDKPFYNKFKDLMNIADETCSDYQINENNVEILPYESFYNDIEMASFEELPAFDAQTKMNPIYALKTATFKYKKSSQDRETNGENSIDDVHTETQKFFSDKVDADLKVELNHIRSAFLIEEARQRAYDLEQSKSLENDDSLFLLDCVELAPSTKGGFGAVLLMRILDNGHLQILNNNLNGDGIPFNWNLLGFNVGSQFFINLGENVGTWHVVSIQNSVLELFPLTVSATFEGEAYIEMSWFFTDVTYTNRTNQGYTLIEGIDNPEDYSNLNYHWARNIQRWYPYLATATKFKPNGIIKTASFKTNGNLVTRKIGETQDVSDSASINNIDISQYKILNPFTHSVKVYADFDTITQLISDVQTVKGYVTVRLNDGRTIKGFINEMDYEWKSEELQLEIEEKFISDYMEITDGSIKLTGYDEKSYLKSFQITNNFVLLFDEYDIQLFPPVRFTLIKINGVLFTDLTAFSDALTDYINE